MVTIPTRNRKRIDWVMVVDALIKNDVSEKIIAAKIGVTVQAVLKWKEGTAAPRYENGVILLSIWSYALTLDFEQIPRI